jgi:hypothetical protein
MWEREQDRIALLELLTTGRLRRRSQQAEAWTLLGEMPWTRRTGRRDEIELIAQDRLLELVERVWPEWRLVAEALSQRQLNPTPSGWRRLRDIMRAQHVTQLPMRLNRRTATAAVAPHSKSTLSGFRRTALGATEVTRDGLVRLRPPANLQLVRGSATLDATDITDMLGEVCITERALLDGTLLQGNIKAVLLVENLGPYRDLTPPLGWLLAHAPGWDTATVSLLLKQLRHVPVLLFGDLDPAGVRIAQHLQRIRADVIWVVPDFWSQYVPSNSLPGAWPEDLPLAGAPNLVAHLAQSGLWLEQEVIALDPRLVGALESMIPATAQVPG